MCAQHRSEALPAAIAFHCGTWAGWERAAWKRNVTFVIHLASCCPCLSGDTGIRDSPGQHCWGSCRLHSQRGHREQGMAATSVEGRHCCVCYLSSLLRDSHRQTHPLFCKEEWGEREWKVNGKNLQFDLGSILYDPTTNGSWWCCICFSYHAGGFVHRGLKGICEGSTSSQHREHDSQPLALNMQGAGQAHHRSCDIITPAFLEYWLVWWCLNHLSRTCKTQMQEKISQIKVLDFQFCCSSSHWLTKPPTEPLFSNVPFQNIIRPPARRAGW